MPCNCSESYNRIDKWEMTYYIVPKVSEDQVKDGACKCTTPPSSNPFGVDPNKCPAKGEVTDKGTITQDPSDGAKVVTKDPKLVNTRYEPEPKCGGSCSCSPGPSDVTDEENAWGEEKEIKVKAKVKGRKLKCKFEPACKNDPAIVGTVRPDGTVIGENYDPQEWDLECKEYEVEVSIKVKEQIKKWEQTTPMSCNCQS